MERRGNFDVLLVGVIFDPEKRRILIGKRKKDSWTFIGGRPEYGEEVYETLKKKIRLKTGLETENLGAVFSGAQKEEEGFLIIYHLCEVVGGKERPNDDIVELKWVRPEEIETHFTRSFHPHLKEYIMNLK